MVLAELVISRRENPKKCTLTPFREDPRFRVIGHEPPRPTRVEGGILLFPDGEPLRPQDLPLGLVIVDGSWKYSLRMVRAIEGSFVRRSLPAGLVTAYPRRSKKGTDPATGLASVEALYAALWIGGVAPPDLLDAYYWREPFLSKNAAWFERHALSALPR